MTDFSYNGNTIYYSVYYIPFLVFSRKKETEKGKKRQETKKCVVIHRQTGNHIITSEICHCSVSLVVRASASGAVDRGFAPRSRHTKGVKNGTSSSLADARIKG